MEGQEPTNASKPSKTQAHPSATHDERAAVDSYFDERHRVTGILLNSQQSPSSTVDMPELSPLSSDRVFPITSALRIDQSTRTSSTETVPLWASRSGKASEANTITEESEASGTPYTSGVASPGSEGSYPDLHYTVRHRYEQTAEGHMVVVSTSEQLQRCEDEPIHAPGAVQGFGAMVVLQMDGDKLNVRMVSEVRSIPPSSLSLQHDCKLTEGNDSRTAKTFSTTHQKSSLPSTASATL
jgi:hypothetical protein